MGNLFGNSDFYTIHLYFILFTVFPVTREKEKKSPREMSNRIFKSMSSVMFRCFCVVYFFWYFISSSIFPSKINGKKGGWLYGVLLNVGNARNENKTKKTNVKKGVKAFNFQKGV